MSEPMVSGKSHDIPKRLIWAAWLKVKSNGGAAGADGVTIEQFEERLKDNLYRLWNRMSSGSYFPGPVRAVEIPKKGGTRVLGIPNVIDRVAQTAAALVCWSRAWSGCSTTTPTATAPGAPRSTRCGYAGSGVFRGTGSSILT
jgi:hypothetical protein